VVRCGAVFDILKKIVFRQDSKGKTERARWFDSTPCHKTKNKYTKTMRHEKTIIDHALCGIENISLNSVYGCDLHHYLFNQDYFIIGYYRAEQWINEMGGAFQVIAEIQEYENLNFGQVSTDLSCSEKVANMYAYILGEQLLNDLESLKEKWDVKLSADDLQEIAEEILSLG